MKFVTNATVAKQFDAGQPAEDTVSVSSDDVQLWVCARAFRTSVATHARSHSMTVSCCIAHDRGQTMPTQAEVAELMGETGQKAFWA